MVLRCVFYSKFDEIAGPKLVAQAPEGYLSGAVFDAISDYIIPKPQLAENLVSVCYEQWKIVSYPMCIESETYSRNFMLFNFGFVFARDTDIRPYELLIQNVAEVFWEAESENGFLSAPGVEDIVQEIVSTIIYDINTHGMCRVEINSANVLSAQVCVPDDDVVEVAEHEVPVPLCDIASLLKDPACDLVLQKVGPYIDGTCHIRAIAEAADVDTWVACHCMRKLARQGLISLLPPFLYSNCYRVTQRLCILWDHVEKLHRPNPNRLSTPSTSSHSGENCTSPFLTRCCASVALRTGEPAPSPWLLLRFFAAFALGGATVADVCRRLPSTNIDERRAVALGLVMGFLTPVRQYLLAPGLLEFYSKVSSNVEEDEHGLPESQPLKVPTPDFPDIPIGRERANALISPTQQAPMSAPLLAPPDGESVIFRTSVKEVLSESSLSQADVPLSFDRSPSTPGGQLEGSPLESALASSASRGSPFPAGSDSLDVFSMEDASPSFAMRTTVRRPPMLSSPRGATALSVTIPPSSSSPATTPTTTPTDHTLPATLHASHFAMLTTPPLSSLRLPGSAGLSSCAVKEAPDIEGLPSFLEGLEGLLDGDHPIDEICCRLRLPRVDLLRALQPAMDQGSVYLIQR
eukprot:Rmarinus@m.26213